MTAGKKTSASEKIRFAQLTYMGNRKKIAKKDLHFLKKFEGFEKLLLKC